jgi:hypothetical protein
MGDSADSRGALSPSPEPHHLPGVSIERQGMNNAIKIKLRPVRYWLEAATLRSETQLQAAECIHNLFFWLIWFVLSYIAANHLVALHRATISCCKFHPRHHVEQLFRSLSRSCQ